jgi:hypothetical protein
VFPHSWYRVKGLANKKKGGKGRKFKIPDFHIFVGVLRKQEIARVLK